MKPKKLLHKSQQNYLVFALIVLIIVTPVFYLILNKIYLREIDESLHKISQFFETKYLPDFEASDIDSWNQYHSDIKILPFTGTKNDSVFNRSYFSKTDQEYEPYRELRKTIQIENAPYTLSVKTNLLESEDLITSIGFLVFSIILILLIGLYFITKKQSIRLWKPFYKTLGEIEKYELDKQQIPELPNTDIVEFNTLNSRITQLIQRNKKVYQSQKEFVENAAHELQTPIAVLKATLDSLIQSQEITANQAKKISSLMETVNRINRLNKNLLLLSRLENKAQIRTETLLVNELINQKLIFFREQAKQKNIDIKTKFEDKLFIESTPEQIDIILNNLLMNAIQHNIKNGTVTISISKQNLEVSNTGVDHPLFTERLFKRFSKTDSSTKGNGLGLAIVKRICDMNHWTIDYSFQHHQHHFIVRF